MTIKERKGNVNDKLGGERHESYKCPGGQISDEIGCKKEIRTQLARVRSSMENIKNICPKFKKGYGEHFLVNKNLCCEEWFRNIFAEN